MTDSTMKYYHFSKWKPEDIDPQIEYRAGWRVSDYWRNKLENVDQSQRRTEVVSMLESLEKIAKVAGVKEFDLGQIKYELNALGYYSELLKEYVFENVRLNEFPKKPSRKQCMFLLPSSLKPGEYAVNLGFETADLNFFEIHPFREVNIHHADMRLLNCNTRSHEEIVGNAREYWKGYKVEDEHCEVLFTGVFTATIISDQKTE